MKIKMDVKCRLRMLLLTGVGASFLLTGSVLQAADDPSKPNFLFIQSDQFRYDLMRFVQDSMPRYAGKTKVRTPNLDRLRSGGVYFSQAYTQCAVCGPARSTFRTGNTLERHGQQSNDLYKKDVYTLGSLFKNKIEAGVTFEMVLVENKGYLAEHYGKWHMPEIFNWSRSGATRIMSYNDYDYVNNQPKFNTTSSSLDYDKRLAEIAGNQSKTEQNGMQRNSYSHYPYVTDAIDKRYGLAPYSTLAVTEPDQQGRDTLPANLTPSCLESRAAMAAIDRLASNAKPFCLTVSFHNPHAPMIATGLYYDYYKALESNMLLPASLSGTDTANAGWNKENNSRYQNAAMVKEWMVAYYALCEEVDHYVGLLLDKLDAKGIADNTFVIFVADHGEALGSHGCREKSKFWEESAHIPMLMRFPGRIAAGSTVDESVVTLDCFATILDYLGASTYDKGDGKSLRRFIEKTNYNKDYDDEAIVTEWDFRTPQTDGTLDRELGSVPNFLCKKGPWKLMMTKLASSTETDMLYNIEMDPYEMYNYIGTNGMKAADAAIGKAEHLKCLLMEWMQRMDGGTNKYFSDKRWNNGEGMGDLAEIKARRKWKTTNIWVSDTAVKVGAPVNVSGQLIRNEYIYLGRTTSGTLTVSNITVQGANAGLFQLSEFTSGTITGGNYKRVKLTYRPTSASQTVSDARIVISHSAGANKVIELSVTAGGTSPSIPSVSFIAPANLTVPAGTNLHVNVSATDPDGISRVYLSKNGVQLTRSEGGAPYEWNGAGQSDPDLMNLQPGTFTLTAKAVDTLGNYAEKTVTVTVSGTSGNLSPYFTEDPFSKPNATVGVAYNEPFSGKAVDPEGGVMTFSKVSGPVWLNVTTGGNAAGTPGSVDVGTNSFMVKVTDTGGVSSTATMKITVVGAQPSVPAVGSIITLKAVNGKYVSATYSTNNTLIANKTNNITNYERFKVVNATNCIALQCVGNSKFVSIDAANGSKPLVATRTSIGSFEKFQLSQSGTQIAIRSVRNTNYVSAVSNGVAPLQASQAAIGAYEKFTWKIE